MSKNKCAIITAALISTAIVLLSSCSDLYNPPGTVEPAVPAGDPGVKIITEEQQISDLYKNAGITKYNVFGRDMFNLTLSHNNYFYTDDIYITITSDIEDAEIYYCLGGSDPSRENPKSLKYTEPVLLCAAGYNDPYVIKAAAYSDGLKSRILTHTYFVSKKINERFDEDTYVFAITSDPYNLYDYEYGILTEGKIRAEWRAANPRAGIDGGTPANWTLRGRESERDAYAEVLKADGQLLVSQKIGIRVHGGWSRGFWDKKSLRLYAREQYDPVFDRFYYPFFGEHRRVDDMGSLVTDYPVLILRNGGNDFQGAYMREEYSHALAKKAGFIDYKVFAPAALFLNGEYYGFFWLQTHYDEKYLMDMYGGDDKDSFDILELWEEPDPGNLTNDDEFEIFAAEIMDIDNFMLYYAFEMYANNWDWPHNNRKLWRYNAEDGTYINKYLDGRLRMLLYDVEAWGLYGNGPASAQIQRVSESVTVFRRLMRRSDMVEKFCSQMFDLINTVFTYGIMEEELNRMIDLCDYEINMAVKTGNLPNNMANIRKNRKEILNFAKKRPAYVIKDMADAFDLENITYGVSVKGNINASVTLNTIKHSGAGNIQSCYFTAHSVVLRAEPHEGYLFDHWEINGEICTFAEVILKSGMENGGLIEAEVFVNPKK